MICIWFALECWAEQTKALPPTWNGYILFCIKSGHLSFWPLLQAQSCKLKSFRHLSNSIRYHIASLPKASPISAFVRSPKILHQFSLLSNVKTTTTTLTRSFLWNCTKREKFTRSSVSMPMKSIPLKRRLLVQQGNSHNGVEKGIKCELVILVDTAWWKKTFKHMTQYVAYTWNTNAMFNAMFRLFTNPSLVNCCITWCFSRITSWNLHFRSGKNAGIRLPNGKILRRSSFRLWSRISWHDPKSVMKSTPQFSRFVGYPLKLRARPWK